MDAGLVVLTVVLGLAIGSFLNVVVYRVPRHESLLHPPSQCPHCAHPIRPWHNVPVAGWLLLRGRCADCHAPISPRYPLVEAGTAALFGVLTARLIALDQRAAIPTFLTFAAVGVALALIDLETKRLPNVIVLPSYPVIFALLAGASLVTGDGWALARAAIAALALFAVFFAIAVAVPAGMGFGDVKLSGLIGAILGYLSWASVVIGAFLGFALGAVIGVSLLASGRATRKTAVPFGPFMVLGAIVAVFVAPTIAAWYS